MLQNRILIAEDNETMSSLLRRSLERAGYEVAVVADGFQAWESLQRETFHMVISDYIMPEMDGVQLCRRLRSDQRLGEMPVIFLTAREFDIDETQLAELSVTHILSKPFSFNELLEIVRSSLASRTASVSASRDWSLNDQRLEKN